MKLNEKKNTNKVKSKKKIVIFIFMLLSIVVVALFVFLFFNYDKPIDDSKLSDEVVILADSGEVDKAIIILDTQITKSQKDEIKKSDLLLQKATVLFNAEKYNDALKIVKEEYKKTPNENNAQFLASIFEKINDNGNAVIYYKKAVELSSKSDVSSSVDYYNYKINLLQGG